MKKILLITLLTFSSMAFADATNDAFNSGASFGKGNASQGTDSLNNPDSVTGSIPGYTANPPQSGYYGGVQGGDGGIGDKGQSAIGSNDAGQAIIDSGNKNPPVTIDPDAPYITNGKDAEGSAESVVDGTNPQCTETSVSKSTWEDFTCSRDLAVTQTCQRNGTPDGTYTESSTIKELNINSRDLTFAPYQAHSTYADLIIPAGYGGEIISGTINNYNKYFDTVRQKLYAFDSVISQDRGNYSFTVSNFEVKDGGALRFSVAEMDVPKTSAANYNNGTMSFTMVLKIRVTVKNFSPSVSWSSSCQTETPAGKLISSTCSVAGGNRPVIKDGETYNVYSDCWQYTDTYVLSDETQGTCSSLMSDPACTQSGSTCTETLNGKCAHAELTYQCQTVHTSEGLLCGGDYICKSGECDETNGAGDSGFDLAVSKLAGLASAGDDVKKNQDELNVKAFTGNAMSCRKAFAGFSNCCKDSGWGQDVGLSSCNSDEMAIGKAKAKKVTVSVGERCDHKVLGVCVQKSKVYCVFGGKLARIIQEQGRRDQLGVGFGSGDSPNCSGITIPQLQKINFDLINFADFYEDLMDNQNIPDTDAMVQQVKDRIAAQVNQQGGKK
jgi:conjugal transfer mating pair stabilization protein TraN